MIFSNKEIKVIEKNLKFGTLRGISIGEYGRGRHEEFLPTPNGIEKIQAENNLGLVIGQSKSGRPRINRGNDDEIYLILSSERGYTRRGCGCIRVPKNQSTEIICRGNGADGDAGRIGSWDAVVVKAKPGDVFRVTWGGSGYGFDATYYYVTSEGKVISADHRDLIDMFETIGVDAPFTLEYKDGVEIRLDEEWKRL